MSTICLGMSLGLSHFGMAGWGVFIAPNTKLAIGEKLLLLCGTPDGSVVFSPQCHLELAVRVPVPGAPDSPVLLAQTVCLATLALFLGLHLISLMSSFEVLLSSISWSK
jgi:hypothetical protein